MNKYRSKGLIVFQVCSVALLMMSAAISASAETVAPAGSGKEPQTKRSDEVIPAPPVPERIRVTAPGSVPFFKGHGVGTQNYICKPTSPTTFGFVLFTPQATLFTERDKQLTTHFFSPNPDEPNIDPNVIGDRQIRVTWEHSIDTSTIWAALKVAATNATDPAFVAKDAVAWLLLDVVGYRNGPTGGDTLKPGDHGFVQRVNTVGGLAPSTGCSSTSDVGHQAFVPYEADYFFFTPGN